MIIKRRAMGYLLIPLCYLLLSACGGSGGGDTAAPTTAPTTTPTTTPVSGKLVPDVRTTGFSDAYKNDPELKDHTDKLITFMSDMVNGVGGDLKWPSDIPVVFSGCGTLNAFFSPGLDLHANFANRTIDPVADPAAVFGKNVTDPAIIMCHELTEIAVTTFLNDPAMQQKIIDNFNPGTDEEKKEAVLATAAIFQLQFLLHELGHALDAILLKDTVNNATKQASFTIPLPNACGEPNCDTIGNDFADWVSASIFSDVFRDLIKINSAAAGNLVKGWFVALDAWTTIAGPGKGISHGLTIARQANMLCYIYGGLPELRAFDANLPQPLLANVLTKQGVDPAGCEAIYNRNTASNNTLLGSFKN